MENTLHRCGEVKELAFTTNNILCITLSYVFSECQPEPVEGGFNHGNGFDKLTLTLK